MQQTKKGYSTVELLIVLSIILLLTTFVATAFSVTKEANHTKSCLMSIRKWSNALSLYVQDYDGTYPAFSTGYFKQRDPDPHLSTNYRAITWGELVLPYLSTNGNAEGCPNVDPNVFPDGTLLRFTFSYAFNTNISEVTHDMSRQTREFHGNSDYKMSFESLTVVLCDARLGIVALDSPDDSELSCLNALYSLKLKNNISSQPFGATRHQGGANYAFADGHVKWFKPEQLSINPKCDGKTPGFGL